MVGRYFFMENFTQKFSRPTAKAYLLNLREKSYRKLIRLF